jgi:hypothetical protein
MAGIAELLEANRLRGGHAVGPPGQLTFDDDRATPFCAIAPTIK